MNITEVLVIILFGFLILNNTVDNVVEGMTGDKFKNRIKILENEIKTKQSKNKSKLNIITGELNDIKDKYKELRAKLNASHKATDMNDAANNSGFKSVPPVGEISSSAAKYPNDCPGKKTKINWPKYKFTPEGMSSRVTDIKINILEKSLTNVQKTQYEINTKYSKSIEIINGNIDEDIMNTGDAIQKKLIDKKF